MTVDKVQRQRFELKYVVPESVALGVRDFVQAHLRIDEYGATQPNLSYPVHSLYLDSDSLKLYQDTINGNKNRHKLRIRFYENGAFAPVYFEIKRRNDNAISKLRGKVRRSAVESLVSGQAPSIMDLESDNGADLVAVQEFHRRLMSIDAKPKAHVSYMREAWETEHGNAVRVTMDREVRSAPEFTASLRTGQDDPILVFGEDVVLELKFTDRFPAWMRDLVRAFGLRQRSAGKYVDGVYNTEPGRIAAWHAVYA